MSSKLKGVMGLAQQFVDRIAMDVIDSTVPLDAWVNITDEVISNQGGSSFQFFVRKPDGHLDYNVTILAFPLQGHMSYRGMAANSDGIVTVLEPSFVESIYKKYNNFKNTDEA